MRDYDGDGPMSMLPSSSRTLTSTRGFFAAAASASTGAAASGSGSARLGLAQLGLGLAEGYGLEAGAIIAAHDQPDMVLADQIRLDQPDRPDRNARSRPAHAIGASGFHRIDKNRV